MSQAGRNKTQAVISQPFTKETFAVSQACPCGMCGGKSGTGKGSPPSKSVSFCRYHFSSFP